MQRCGDSISKEQVMTREIILVDQVRSASHSVGPTDLDCCISNTCAFTVLSKWMTVVLKENMVSCSILWHCLDSLWKVIALKLLHQNRRCKKRKGTICSLGSSNIIIFGPIYIKIDNKFCVTFTRSYLVYKKIFI